MTNLEILDSRTSLLKTLTTSKIFEVAEAMDAARKDEAVAFGQWITDSGFEPARVGLWERMWEHDDNEFNRYTTEELYQLFKNQ